MTGHVFIDESKRRDYLLGAGVVIPDELDAIRKVLRGLILPGQRRLHMKDANDGRKPCVSIGLRPVCCLSECTVPPPS